MVHNKGARNEAGFIILLYFSQFFCGMYERNNLSYRTSIPEGMTAFQAQSLFLWWEWINKPMEQGGMPEGPLKGCRSPIFHIIT
jgi:hypothetical protein